VSGREEIETYRVSGLWRDDRSNLDTRSSITWKDNIADNPPTARPMTSSLPSRGPDDSARFG